ncbi:MAG TPA: exodeoxyribonuclease VII large subunit [Clostridiales bacterium]|mgnify:CR=1 FL=1|nr:exodeoxyribonuclease VII large subunit [Clostridiales bacterium]
MDLSSLRERETTPPLSVTELNEYIKALVESDPRLARVTVRGEISNFVRHTSGHLYFSLKDEEGQVRAVMFRSAASHLLFRPADGMKVILFGSVSVYPKGGSYQIYVNAMQPDGVGALYLTYEQLKEKLAKEGLFDEEHKRPIPKMPRNLGVITSPTGAAIRDIIHITARRFPATKIYLYPALVQGEGAVPSLLTALDFFEKSRLCDTVIIGRGGGSIEDLWAFNSEALARKIYSMTVPVISAVGHEIDFTICDFVADLRAPTPSAAAEIAVPDRKELLLTLDRTAERLDAALLSFVGRKRERLDALTARRPFTDPASVLAPFSEKVENYRSRADAAARMSMEKARATLTLLAGKAEALSPMATLTRGYCLPEKEGKTISSVREIRPGETLSLLFADGTATAEIKETERAKR